MKVIKIAVDFTAFPGGRYRIHGKGSGEEFRDKLLVPAMEANEQAEIDLDGTSGYPSSFLEEAFGGLVRKGFAAADIRAKFRFKAGPPYQPYVQLIQTYIDAADRAAKATA